MLFQQKIFSLVLIIIGLGLAPVMAQPTWTIDPFGKSKKPEQYEEKKLPSEKTAEKKYTTFRQFMHNTGTHYNYYFNASNKLNAVVERAKQEQKPDYSKLLPFYPFSLDATAAQQTELDSVIYKATAGILLHDLRTDWVDNMYLLIGKSYFYRNELDSAALTFQFINYNLFPRKKKEDDNRVVGTNSANKTNMLSIANSENRNLWQQTTSRPPSRNDALIWLARTLIETEDYGDAAGLINILQNDPNLPVRLKNDLEEVNAYWFYKQELFDSSAVHLEKALTNAEGKMDQSRWEYLLAQMLEMSGQYSKASEYYGLASKHTVDPVMDIYAQLHDAKMLRDNNNQRELDKSIDNLVKMSKKDKYENFTDIIFYSAGQLSMQKPDTASALKFYEKSLASNKDNSSYKNKTLLVLGNLAYDQKNYVKAAGYYDSLDLSDPSMKDVASKIAVRQSSLDIIVEQLNTVAREDSLQRIALMSETDREQFLRALIKSTNKASNSKEEEIISGPTLNSFTNTSAQSPDLFETDSKGEWYFYNSNLKTRGFTEFKTKWGKRDNVDNWRRKSAAIPLNNLARQADNDPLSQKGIDSVSAVIKKDAFSYEAMLENLPLSQAQLDSSNAVIANSLVTLAKTYQFELEEYDEAIKTYDEYLRRFPNNLREGEIYLGLYYCYNKLGQTAKAEEYKKLLMTQFGTGKPARMLTNPESLKTGEKNDAVTRQYEEIYNKFIEGNFEEAIAGKQRLDSMYGNHYWSPQLLYIEAIGYVRKQEDSMAIRTLNNIVAFFPESPLSGKSSTLIDVLKRRKDIEAYLTKLDVSRVEEDKIMVADQKTVAVQKQTIQPAPVKQMAPISKPSMNKIDTIQALPGMVSGGFVLEPETAHSVVMILEHVDPVYVNEARNAFMRYNREKHAGKTISIVKDVLDKDRQLLVFETFKDADEAMQYFDQLKKAAAIEVSWLQPNKYSFIIITAKNLGILKTGKTLTDYRQLLNGQYPGKF